MTADEVVERVIALWDRQNGWIPGGVREDLAEALGVEPERVRSSQTIQRDLILDGIAAEGEVSSIVDDDGEAWIFSPYHNQWRLVSELSSSAIVASGFDSGVAQIERSFGLGS